MSSSPRFVHTHTLNTNIIKGKGTGRPFRSTPRWQIGFGVWQHSGSKSSWQIDGIKMFSTKGRGLAISSSSSAYRWTQWDSGSWSHLCKSMQLLSVRSAFTGDRFWLFLLCVTISSCTRKANHLLWIGKKFHSCSLLVTWSSKILVVCFITRSHCEL